ncbi:MULTISPECIES: hypothetical protein [Amycolatopsis]|uniref:Uncharacterized protein n=1 Tax=Amycolatopsis albidoflavus TaxID=102226 RepID=A0ABW5I7E3_9PSEU
MSSRTFHEPGHAVPFADLDTTEPPHPAPSLEILQFLARNASYRAATLLAGGLADDPDPIVDLVCILAECPAGSFEDAAARAGLRTGELGRLRSAYTFGRVHGVRTARRSFDPPPGVMEQAAKRIAARHSLRGSTPAIDTNRLTYPAAQVQLRLGTNKLWYPYTQNTAGEWFPARGENPDPSAAYTAAVDARNRRS